MEPKRRSSDVKRYSEADVARLRRDWEDSQLLDELRKSMDEVKAMIQRHLDDNARHLSNGQGAKLIALLKRGDRSAILIGTGRSAAVTIGEIIIVLAALAAVVGFIASHGL